MIKVIDPNGEIRYPFGKAETPEEKVARLEEENAEIKKSMLVALKGIAELNAQVHKVDE